MLDSYPRISPLDIIVNRDTRQRQENINDIEDLKQSLGKIGMIHPIIIRSTDNGMVLVAGERRHKAALALGWTEVPVRLFEDLSVEEAEVIELEENAKRKELHWRDQVRTIARLHTLYKTRTTGWRIEQTAEEISLNPISVRKILHVNEAMDEGKITKADGWDQAYNMLHRFAERKAESIVADLVVKGAAIFGTAETKPINGENNSFTTVTAITIAEETVEEDATTADMLDEEPPAPKVEPTPIAEPKPEPKIVPDPVLCANFAEWVKSYNGPKFTLIHCDFPYGNYRGGDSKGAMSGVDTEDFYDNTEDVYWNLLEILTSNLDKMMSYSAHLMFWFNMNFYTETVSRLRKVGLMVHDHPLIWHKTGGPGGLGVGPGTATTYPRRTYDTALLAVRGNRPLAKPGLNSYAAPTAGNKIHPSQKSEPMLRFFLQMLVDETTTMLDPTCGSAAALRAAEDLGAKHILGLEMDPNYARDANTKTLQARVLRQAGAFRREE